MLDYNFLNNKSTLLIHYFLISHMFTMRFEPLKLQRTRATQDTVRLYKIRKNNIINAILIFQLLPLALSIYSNIDNLTIIILK